MHENMPPRNRQQRRAAQRMEGRLNENRQRIDEAEGATGSAQGGHGQKFSLSSLRFDPAIPVLTVPIALVGWAFAREVAFTACIQFAFFWCFAAGLFYLILSPGKIAGPASLAAMAVIIGLLAWWPAPLNIDAMADQPDYPEGQIAYGIKWNANFSALRVAVENASNHAYADLDLLIRTDLLIVHLGSNVGEKCSYEPYWAGSPQPTFVGLGYTDQSGNHTKPLTATSGSIFRVHCDRLLDHKALELLAALVLNPQTPFLRQALGGLSFKGVTRLRGVGLRPFQRYANVSASRAMTCLNLSTQE